MVYIVCIKCKNHIWSSLRYKVINIYEWAYYCIGNDIECILNAYWMHIVNACLHILIRGEDSTVGEGLQPRSYSRDAFPWSVRGITGSRLGPPTRSNRSPFSCAVWHSVFSSLAVNYKYMQSLLMSHTSKMEQILLLSSMFRSKRLSSTFLCIFYLLPRGNADVCRSK